MGGEITMKGDNHFMITKDDNLKAVYSSDLDSFLENLGMAEKFHAGEIEKLSFAAASRSVCFLFLRRQINDFLGFLM